MSTIRLAALATAVTLALGLAACNNDATDDAALDDSAAMTTPDVVAPVDPMGPGTGVNDTASDMGMDPAGEAGMAGYDTPPARLGVAGDATTGTWLADADGRALYYLENDTDGSACTGECLQAWPPVIAGDDVPEVGDELQADLLGTIERADGTRQLTYNGHPLYYYVRDTGTTPAGHDLSGPGGDWYLLTPAGTEFDDMDDDMDGDNV